MVAKLQQPKEGSQPLHFDSQYSRSLGGQLFWLLWKVPHSAGSTPVQRWTLQSVQCTTAAQHHVLCS